MLGLPNSDLDAELDHLLKLEPVPLAAVPKPKAKPKTKRDADSDEGFKSGEVIGTRVGLRTLADGSLLDFSNLLLTFLL